MKGRYSASRKEELVYLQGLIDDFGTEPRIEVTEAINLIYSRYEVLAEVIGQTLVNEPSGQLFSSEQNLLTLVRSLHRALYKGIVYNAGEFRKNTDSGGGNVFFGRNQKYRGVQPELIEKEMLEACLALSKAKDPVKGATQFYLDLIWIHPFYDANGRIGRLTLNAYLFVYGLYISWIGIDEKYGKFISKQNHYHNRRETDSENKRTYFLYFYDFVKKHVNSLSDLDDE